MKFEGMSPRPGLVKIKKIMLTSVDAAINTADSFESYLMLVLEGNMTPEEMIKMIKGNANNDEA